MKSFKLCSLALFALVTQPLFAEVGILTFVKGDVRVDGAPAKNGEGVGLGSQVETGFGSCSILIGDEQVIHLGKQSSIVISKLLISNGEQKTEVNVKEGSVRAVISNPEKRIKEFKLKTRAGVMGVRGTHIAVFLPPDTNAPVQFVTFDGEAFVSLNAPDIAGRREFIIRSDESLKAKIEAKSEVQRDFKGFKERREESSRDFDQNNQGEESGDPSLEVSEGVATVAERKLSPEESLGLIESVAPLPEDRIDSDVGEDLIVKEGSEGESLRPEDGLRDAFDDPFSGGGPEGVPDPGCFGPGCVQGDTVDATIELQR